MGRMKRWRARAWGDRSQLERVEVQYRVATRSMPWIFLLSWALLPLVRNFRSDPPIVAITAMLGVLLLVMAVLGDQSLIPALDQYLGRGKVSRRALSTLGTLMAVTLVLLVVIQALGGLDHGFMAFLVLYVTVPFSLVACLVMPVRTFLLRHLALAAGITAAFALAGMWDLQLLAVAACALFGPALSLITARSGAWSLRVMVQAEQGREAQARLAVAEERLRFGRDLHDVMGRNLAVIALKSELAARLASRGKPEGIEEMAEVQRIARDTQRELRDVVRGYREADLGAELAGAHGVLTAAGIRCHLTGTATADTLPDSTQSVLGWVVREATTNVLRHGDPAQCTVTLHRADGDAVLTVENDGATEAEPGALPPISGGSGLAGLRERLAGVDGTLEAGPVRGDNFRLTARVPVPKQSGRGGGTGQIGGTGQTDGKVPPLGTEQPGATEQPGRAERRKVSGRPDHDGHSGRDGFEVVPASDPPPGTDPPPHADPATGTEPERGRADRHRVATAAPTAPSSGTLRAERSLG